MKNCEQYRELIFTDYIDGQLDAKMVAMVEDHLMDCSDCRLIFKELKTSAAPIKTVELQEVPSELWSRIKENIEEQPQEQNLLEEMLENLKGWLAFPKMVPVLASFLVMFLAGSVTLNTMYIQQAQAKDQGEYLVSVLTPDTSTSPEAQLGSPIESYFL